MTTNGKIALVTGAGSGIGRAVALALLHEGYAVVLAGRRREPLEATARPATASGSRTLAVPPDVTDRVSVKTLFARAHEVCGPRDLLFTHEGTGSPPAPPA